MKSTLTQYLRLASCVIILTSLWARPVTAAAEGSDNPVAVLSVASAERLLEDLTYLTHIMERPDLDNYLQVMRASFLETVDRQRPAGLLITMENSQPKGLGFLPVSDAEKLFGLLERRLGATLNDSGNGIMKLEMGKDAYLKQRGEWLYVTDHPRHLSDLPADPVAMLENLHQDYTVALRIYIRNIPQRLKDVVDYTIQTKIDMELRSHQPGDSESAASVANSLRKSMKRWISSLINDSDQVTIGWAVDTPKRRTYLDLHARAKEDSRLSRQLNDLMNNRSTFTGFFVEDAAIAFQGSLRATEEMREQSANVLNYLREKAREAIEADPEAPGQAKEIVDSVLDVVDQTVRQGKTDIGGTLLLAPGSFNFAGGTRVADGRALADAFQELFELAKNEPDVPEINFYDSKYKDLDLHTLVLPIDKSDVDARKLLGETVDITIATGPEQLFIAIGKDADDLLETIVDESQNIGKKKVPPLHLRAALRPVMNYLASIDRNNEDQHVLAELINQARGGDAIELKIQQIENGVGCRLIIEEGILELVGKASRNAND